jgi:nitrite reductase/ring-hydroxylating ferredoxin subunit
MDETQDADWHRVADRAALATCSTLRVEVRGRAIALYDVDGTVYATDDTCTHAQASLADGYLDGESIECPLHQARFHVPTGRALCAPATRDLAVHEVRVYGAEIWLRVRAGDAARAGDPETR